MTHCIRCSEPITPIQACVPIFRGSEIEMGPPSAWRHYLTCCTECGALGDTHTEPKPAEHRTSCSHYEAPEWCRAPIEGVVMGVDHLVCTRPVGHKEKHRAKARFAGPTDLTVTWPRSS